jgi:hypothetical protein
LIRRDFNCRIGEEQIKLLHLFDFWGDWLVDKYNFRDKRCGKDNSCHVEGKELVEFCESNDFEILIGKFGSDIRGNSLLLISIVVV